MVRSLKPLRIATTFCLDFTRFGEDVHLALRFTAYNGIPANIINQVCQSYIERCTRHSDCLYSNTVPVTCHKPKNVFDSTSDFWFSSVVLLLLLGQGMISVTFLADLCLNVFQNFLSYISAVGICDLIFFVKEVGIPLAVVNRGFRYCVICDNCRGLMFFPLDIFSPQIINILGYVINSNVLK